MNRFQSITFLLFVVFSFKISEAQWTDCIDETRVQPLYQCNQEFFDPVCGCDGYTYRNLCNAYNNYGVSNWVGGVCYGFFLDIYPNPVTNLDPMRLNIQFEYNMVSSLNIRIIDYYGQLVHQQLFNAVNKVETQVDLRFAKRGVYLLIVESGNGQYWVERILRL